MCCASDNHNYMCHTCAKEFFKFELQLRSYWQNIKFSRYCPKFPIFTNFVIFQVYLQLLRPTASSYKFYGRDMPGILFFIFASCHPLTHVLLFGQAVLWPSLPDWATKKNENCRSLLPWASPTRFTQNVQRGYTYTQEDIKHQLKWFFCVRTSTW